MNGENWRKSTHSGGSGGQCVEVASTLEHVAVRDTKDNGNGPILRIRPADWTQLMKALRQRTPHTGY